MTFSMTSLRRRHCSSTKYQAYLEKRFSLFKGDLSVATVYLKKPSRILGLLQVDFIAMIVAVLLDRGVRHSMERSGETACSYFPRPAIPPPLTAPRILQAFKDVCWYEFESSSENATFAIGLVPLQ